MHLQHCALNLFKLASWMPDPFWIFFWRPLLGYFLRKVLFTYSQVAQTLKRPPTMRETRVQLLERKWQPTPVFLPGKSHGWRSLVGYSPWLQRVRHDRATSLSPDILNMKCPWAKVSKLLLWEMATSWQHVFMPNSGYWGNQSLGESPVPGLSVRVECARRNTHSSCVPFFFLTPVPWTHPNSRNTTLGRVLSSIGGRTQRKEAGGGNPTSRRHGAHGAFQSSSSPEAPLGAVGVVSLQEDLSGSGGCGTMQRGAGSPGPWGRAHWLAHSPQLRQPRDSPSLGTKSAQVTKAWGE